MSIPETTARTVTVPEAAALLGISRGAAYEAARSGQVAGCNVIRVGHRLVIPRAPLMRALGIANESPDDDPETS